MFALLSLYCPSLSVPGSLLILVKSSAIFIGRTEYSVSMYKEDSLEKRWNISFSDYTVHASKKDSHNYQFLHLASTSNGELATVDKYTGEQWLVRWEKWYCNIVCPIPITNTAVNIFVLPLIGSVLWERNFGSPVVSTYVMETSSLIRVPLMSLGVETMHNLLDTLSTPGIPVAFFQKVLLIRMKEWRSVCMN